MENQSIVAQDSALVKAVTAAGVAPSVGEFIVASFTDNLPAIRALADEAESIVVSSVEEKAKMKRAREIRLKLRELRVQADKVRKDLKEDSNRYGKAVQAAFNLIANLCEPAEEHLEKQEKYEEYIILQQQNELRTMRQLSVDEEGLTNFLTQGIDLGKITEVDFQDLMDMARMRLARQQSEQAKAQEEARLLKEENERIRQEQAQAKAKEDAIRLEKEAAEAKLRQMEAEAKAKAEREAQEEAKRLYLTSAATDFEKIEDVQQRLRGFELPEASSEFGQKLMADIRYLLNKIDGHISQNIEKLKA
jgi:hypothetical protein